MSNICYAAYHSALFAKRRPAALARRTLQLHCRQQSIRLFRGIANILSLLRMLSCVLFVHTCGKQCEHDLARWPGDQLGICDTCTLRSQS